MPRIQSPFACRVRAFAGFRASAATPNDERRIGVCEPGVMVLLLFPLAFLMGSRPWGSHSAKDYMGARRRRRSTLIGVSRGERLTDPSTSRGG